MGINMGCGIRIREDRVVDVEIGRASSGFGDVASSLQGDRTKPPNNRGAVAKEAVNQVILTPWYLSSREAPKSLTIQYSSSHDHYRTPNEFSIYGSYFPLPSLIHSAVILAIISILQQHGFTHLEIQTQPLS